MGLGENEIEEEEGPEKLLTRLLRKVREGKYKRSAAKKLANRELARLER